MPSGSSDSGGVSGVCSKDCGLPTRMVAYLVSLLNTTHSNYRGRIPLACVEVSRNLEIPKDLIFHDLCSDDPEWRTVARHDELHNFVKRPVFQLDASRLGESAHGVALGLWIRRLQIKGHWPYLLRACAAQQFERNCVHFRSGKQLI